MLRSMTNALTSSPSALTSSHRSGLERRKILWQRVMEGSTSWFSSGSWCPPPRPWAPSRLDHDVPTTRTLRRGRPRRDLAGPLVSLPLSNEHFWQALLRATRHDFFAVVEARSKQPPHSMARAITPSSAITFGRVWPTTSPAVRFAGSGESGDDNLQRAAEIEAKAFSAAERLGGDRGGRRGGGGGSTPARRER